MIENLQTVTSKNHFFLLGWPKSSATLAKSLIFMRIFVNFLRVLCTVFVVFCVYRVPDSSLFSKFQMTLDKIELRVLMRYRWKRQLSARYTAEEICDAEGEGSFHYTTVSLWYKRFDSGNLNLEDQPRSGLSLIHI